MAETSRSGTESAATILIVDDGPENLAVLGELLQPDYRVRVANSGERALAVAASDPVPDLILLDVMMPGLDGYGVLARLHESPATREIPVIFVTAMDGAEDEQRGIDLGAVDYITKPLHPGIVLARVRTHLELKRARDLLRDRNVVLEAALVRKANFDDLTGLPNRNLLADRLGHATERCRRDGRELALLTVNLDRFKQINDSLGLSAGDAVLREVARRLASGMREADTLARVERDEFVLLDEEGDADRVARIAAALHASLAQPFMFEGRELFLSASIGIAMFPKDGGDGETLLRNSVAATFDAKAAGGSGFRFYAAEMNERSLEHLEFETALRRALDRGEYVLHYQPQVELRSGRIFGAEALVRWQSPDRGLVPPGEFIDIAEQTGLIVPLGEWVLKTACAQNKAWQRAGLPPISVAVNFSARQFALQDVAAMAGGVLRETGLEPRYLELELTESAVMADAEAFIEATEKLKGLDVTLSIDDFGTGFSSLSYLKRFDLDRLKIDQSFVRDVTRDGDSAAIAVAVIALAHSLKLTAIAEGVETADQLAFLRAQGCDEMQGYYFSKPLPAADFEQLLRSGRTLALPQA